EVLTTNARPALPAQRPPLRGRTRCTTLGDAGEDAASLTDSLLRRRCADTASEAVSARAAVGVGVDAQAPRSRVGESATSRGAVVPAHAPRKRGGERATSARGVHTSQGLTHTARQATPTGLSRNGAEALDKARGQGAPRGLQRHRGEAASGRLCDPATSTRQVHGAEAPAKLLLHVPRRLRDTFIDAPGESVDAPAGGLVDLTADLAAGGAGEPLLPPLLSFVAPLVPQLPHEGEVSDLGPVLHSAREVASHEVGQTLGEVGELLRPHPQAVTQDNEEGLAHPVEEFTPLLREVVNRLSQRPEGLPQL